MPVNIANIGERAHPQHADKVMLWDFLLASYRGGLGMQGRHGMSEAQASGLKPSGYYPGLFRFKREGSADYINRVAMTPYRSYARKIIQTFANYVTAAEPERTGAESMADFMLDSDRKGTTLLAAMRRELALQAAIGEINILVDMPSTEGPVATRYQAMEAGLRPYCVTIMPQSVVDWSIGDTGRYDWCIIEETFWENSPAMASAVMRRQRTYWDASEWRIYREPDGKNTADWPMIAQGAHSCGEVPIIRVSSEDIDNTPVTPESWAYDLFDLNRAIYNLESVDLVNLYYQTFGQLVLPSQSALSEADVKTASVSEAFTETMNEKGISRYIQPTGAESKAIGDKIAALKGEMYNVAGLFHKTDSRAAETAESKAWDFQEVNQFLAALAKTADWIEREKLRLAGKWMKRDVQAEVSYPKDYRVEEVEKTVAAILDLKATGFGSDVARKELLKKVYRDLLKDVPPETMSEIEREVDASTEVDPLAGMDINREEEAV